MVDPKEICGYIIALYNNPQAEQFVELGGRVYSSMDDMMADLDDIMKDSQQPSLGFEFVVLDESGMETLSVNTPQQTIERFFAVEADKLIADGEVRDAAVRRVVGLGPPKEIPRA